MASVTVEEGKTAYWTVTKNGYVTKVGSALVTGDVSRNITLPAENLITKIYHYDDTSDNPLTLPSPTADSKTFDLASLSNLYLKGDLKFPLIENISVDRYFCEAFGAEEMTSVSFPALTSVSGELVFKSSF